MTERQFVYQGYIEPVFVPDVPTVTIDSWFSLHVPPRLEPPRRALGPAYTEVLPFTSPPPPPVPSMSSWDSPLRSRPQTAKHVPFGANTLSSVAPILPVPVNRSGRGKPLLRRTPVPLLPADSEERPDPEARRIGRNFEILQQIINSLLRTGAIYKDDDGIWRIAADELKDDDNNIIGP